MPCISKPDVPPARGVARLPAQYRPLAGASGLEIQPPDDLATLDATGRECEAWGRGPPGRYLSAGGLARFSFSSIASFPLVSKDAGRTFSKGFPGFAIGMHNFNPSLSNS